MMFAVLLSRRASDELVLKKQQTAVKLRVHWIHPLRLTATSDPITLYFSHEPGRRKNRQTNRALWWRLSVAHETLHYISDPVSLLRGRTSGENFAHCTCQMVPQYKNIAHVQCSLRQITLAFFIFHGQLLPATTVSVISHSTYRLTQI